MNSEHQPVKVAGEVSDREGGRAKLQILSYGLPYIRRYLARVCADEGRAPSSWTAAHYK